MDTHERSPFRENDAEVAARSATPRKRMGGSPDAWETPEERARRLDEDLLVLVEAARRGELKDTEFEALLNILRALDGGEGAPSIGDTPGIGNLAPPYPLWLKEKLPRGFSTGFPHIGAIAGAMDGLLRPQPLWDRVALFIPPRHGKTTNASVFGALYFMMFYPGTTVLVTSNTQRNVETLLSRPARGYAALWNMLDRAKVGADEWHMRNGSVMLARGVGSPPIGRGVHFLVIDDPIKSSEEADSLVFREKAWQWYVTDIWQRLEPGARVLMTMARWNEDDVAARALSVEPDRWKVLRFPVLAEVGDPLGRAPGEALWPERFPTEYWLEERRKLEAAGQIRTWHALWMQDPQPASGECYFDVEYLQAVTRELNAPDAPPHTRPLAVLPEGAEGFHGELRVWEYPNPETKPLAPGAGYVLGADVASGVTQTGLADYSTFFIARTDTREVVATYRGRPTPQEFAQDIKRVCTDDGWYKGCVPCVERNNHGLVVCAALEEWGIYQYRHPVGGDSLGKADEVTAAGYPTNQKTKAIIDAGLRYGIATAAHVWRRAQAPTAIAALSHPESESPVFYDLDTYKELLHYVEKPGGKREGAAGYHDDLMRALALTHFMLQEQKPRTGLEKPPPAVRYMGSGGGWSGSARRGDRSNRHADRQRAIDPLGVGVGVLPPDEAGGQPDKWIARRGTRRLR